jgi:hypothetical protein
MSKIEFLSIELNKDQPSVYYPGETLSGTVSLGLKDRMEINNVALKVSGKGHAKG